jgi:hypothetical protein
LIEITRRLAMQLRPVFRQALNLSTRGTLPPLTFQTGPDGLRARSRWQDAAVEYHVPGDHPIGQIPVPFELLADSEARRDDPVQLQTTSEGRVLAQWRDGSVPQMIQYDAPDPVEAAQFPRLPKKVAKNPPGLLKALHDAMQTTEPEPIRYATNCVQLRGTAGQIVATDGRQLILQSGFEFPWKNDLLVPRTKVFGSRELPQDESVQIGVSGKWFAVRIGPWRIFREINTEGRFPEVRHHVPRAKDAVAQFQLPPDDAAFLRKNLPRLPGDEDYNLPVTVDLNGQVAVRSKARDQVPPTELVLSGATLSGDPIRLNMNRQYLARALQLGFRQVHVYSPKVPVLCEEEGRQYVWALLDPASAVAPASDAMRIASPQAADAAGGVTHVPICSSQCCSCPSDGRFPAGQCAACHLGYRRRLGGH